MTKYQKEKIIIEFVAWLLIISSLLFGIIKILK